MRIHKKESRKPKTDIVIHSWPWSGQQKPLVNIQSAQVVNIRSAATEFKSDCLIWMLFNTSNLSAGADGLEWNGKKWSLVNHFIPFTESEVGASGRFESDFMSKYLPKLKLSKEAKAVLDEGRKIYKQCHSIKFDKKIRDELKLNRPDVGWYQIRRAFEANGTENFSDFKDAYGALSLKLRPLVLEYGFLK